MASKHIKDINFGFENKFITVSSNSEKVHLFFLEEENLKSKLNVLGFINSYLGSEWSKVQYTIPENEESFCVWVKEKQKSFYMFLKTGFVRLVIVEESTEFQNIDFEDLRKSM